MNNLLKKRIEELTESDFLCGSPKNNFTIVPNEIIRSNKLSACAVKVLEIILSNNEGWKTRITNIREQMYEGKQAVASAIAMLKENEYLKKYIVKDPKGRICSKFYVATWVSGYFDIKEREEMLNELGYTIVMEKSRNPKTRFSENNTSRPGTRTDGVPGRTGYPDGRGTPSAGQTAHKNTIIKEDQKKEDQNKEDLSVSTKVETDTDLNDNSSTFPDGDKKETKSKPKKKRLSCIDRVNNQHKRLARKLYISIDTAETVRPLPGLSSHRPENEREKRIQKYKKDWAVDFAKMEFIDKIPLEEIKEAMDWYEKNIDVAYTPEAYSGHAFRKKYQNILNGMSRNCRKPNRMSPANNSTALREQVRNLSDNKKEHDYTINDNGDLVDREGKVLV